MNLSETAFLLPSGRRLEPALVHAQGRGGALRSRDARRGACALGERAPRSRTRPALFDTLSGRLTARRAAEPDAWIELDFPERRESAHEDLPELFARTRVQPVYFGKNAYDYFVEVATAHEVRDLAPDFAALGKLPVRGVIVTAAARCRQRSRFRLAFLRARRAACPRTPSPGRRTVVSLRIGVKSSVKGRWWDFRHLRAAGQCGCGDRANA